ncbi:FecR family protein [Pseudomonas phoenicis]|uniref:FecR family protein n=1 Tax=unclassified Pseudomonas TaxID=196821 RepID=UPI0039A191DD
MTALPDPTAPNANAEQALDWFTRLRDESLSDVERAAYAAWLRVPGNAQAYAEVERLWQQLELPAQRVAKAQRHSPRHSRAPRYAVAASLLVAVTVGWLALPWLQRMGSDYTTRVGERQDIALADGSHLRLDSDSVVDVDVHGPTRRVRLRQGRLFAEVTHDGRPFVVEVGDAQVRVLGTQFTVGRHADEDEVVLLSGSVDVSVADHRQRLSPGQQLRVRGQRLEAPRPVDTERALAWRDGQLRARDLPLGQVLETLTRYQGKRLVLLDGAVARRSVSGSFNLDQPDAALDALLSQQHLQAHSVLGRWVIVR